MARREYSEEFRRDAVKQVIENGYGIIETAERLGVHYDYLRNWIKKYQSPEAEIEAKKSQDTQAEIKRLEKELKRVTEERDIFLCLHSLWEKRPQRTLQTTQIKVRIYKRVARLMKEAKLCGVGNYRRKPKYKAGAIHKAHPNHLKQCFLTHKPNVL